jgi:vesicle coat complex subunit
MMMATLNEEIVKAMQALDSADVNERASAIETIGEHAHEPAVDRLIVLYEEIIDDPGTRFMIVKALGKIGHDSAVPALMDALKGDDLWVRAAAVGALTQVGVAAIVELANALNHSDKAVRRAAAKALGKIDGAGENPDVIRSLSASLLDIDDGVRRFAAQALGRLGAETLVPELAEALTDDDPKVRIAAFKALAEIKTPEAQQAVRNWARQ